MVTREDLTIYRFKTFLQNYSFQKFYNIYVWLLLITHYLYLKNEVFLTLVTAL